MGGRWGRHGGEMGENENVSHLNELRVEHSSGIGNYLKLFLPIENKTCNGNYPATRIESG